MLDLKTIKNITIAEGSVKKITNSSGVVLWQKQTGSSASLDIDLNNQWVASTKTLDGYKVYMSNSNQWVDNGYASMKFKFKGQPNFKLWINSYAETTFDYTVAWNLDVNFPTSNPSYGSSGVKAHTRGNQKDPTSISNFTEVDYPNDGGEHFVVVTFRKDGTGSNYDDRGYVAVKLTLISTTWVVSSTEFVKKDDKYYQRINEVETYAEGFTSNTGNYKEGNELTVTYKQGTADDFMIVGSGKYYKKYAYVTPVNTEINTGDYIQGDLISTITNAVYVKYLDGSAKYFTGLTSIQSDTVSNKANAKEVVISEGVTSIGESGFGWCKSLTSVTFPDSLTSIGFEAFYDCYSLTDITIPANVTNIDGMAFASCSGLTNVTIENSNAKLTYNSLAFNGVSSTEAILFVPSNLLTDYKADSGWTGAFKAGIYAIGTTPTPSVTVICTDNSVKKLYNLTTINSYTNLYRNIAKEVVIGDSITSIGYRPFYSATALTSVTISNSVTSIGEGAFQSCSSLTGITIPDSVTSINSEAFLGCSIIKDLIIPNSVTTIGSKAFQSCIALETVTIHNSNAKLTYWNNAFYRISSSAKLYVPSNLLSDYQADTSWTNAFKGGIFEIPS